jgi:rfaE bifunctional protein kinase chain/domain
MTPERLQAITARYAQLRIALVGDYCLDRYLEIDPARTEISIETQLPVYNVTRVRSQPGAAGTILNNLVALGIGQIHAVGFCGVDGEGFELRQALEAMPGVELAHFLNTPLRRTFTYCKPLVMHTHQPPQELNRIDSKNWTATPPEVEAALIASLEQLATQVDALIVMDQVDLPETGVVTQGVRAALARIANAKPNLRIVADSRRGLAQWPPVTMKMNAAELAKLTGETERTAMATIAQQAAALAQARQREVCVTLAERGLLGATPTGDIQHVPALPLRGPIDVVGAGDSVTANLTAALAAGASLREALELAAVASSIIIHQLGTTGVATREQIAEHLSLAPS